jgi:flagellar P-ring protein precursor FlgI
MNAFLHPNPGALRGAIRHALVMALLLAAGCGPAFAAVVDTVRVKDLGRLDGWRDNVIVGYGIVTGLAGTGDSSGSRATRQALANVYTQFNLNVPPEQVQSRNVALVMVSATLTPFAHEGDALDITVTSAGDARSLVGGSLLLTPLNGPNGRTYALAQGQLAVGGYRYDANGNVVQKNHATTGSVPGGAIVELGVGAHVLRPDHTITFLLAEPDYTTAARVAAAINAQLGASLARARDASGIEVAVPEEQRAHLVDFVARVESATVEPDRRAKVVINERTGTLIAGGDVRIAPVAISQGDLKLSIVSQTTVSQPYFVGRATGGIQTMPITNSKVDVDETGAVNLVSAANTVADLMLALAKTKISTRDAISILRAIKASGALHAELIVQ